MSYKNQQSTIKAESNQGSSRLSFSFDLREWIEEGKSFAECSINLPFSRFSFAVPWSLHITVEDRNKIIPHHNRTTTGKLHLTTTGKLHPTTTTTTGKFHQTTMEATVLRSMATTNPQQLSRHLRTVHQLQRRQVPARQPKARRQALQAQPLFRPLNPRPLDPRPLDQRPLDPRLLHRLLPP
ncbi:hypothetical protein M3Y96_00762000 [Aphelenchoides besseyi]|nr:hypothetical protein M3Y96_00762000 [Aphelenchoides besseyi]